MAVCYRCEVEITIDNEADEHIILNACGGRLKSKALLCKICNSTFGETFDAQLAQQTNDLANLLLIKRARGIPQPIKGTHSKTGEEYLLQFGGEPVLSKPKVSEKIEGAKINLSIIANNEKKFRQVLSGLKRKKYPQLDIEKTIESAQRSSKYLDDPISFKSTIGGKEAFKSIVKTAINYFILKKGERVYIKHLLAYLENKEELDVVWIHYPDDLIYAPIENEVSHIIKVVGNPTEKILYAYIELFNLHNFIVKLNDNYDGQYINETYVFDVINTEELNKVIPLDYSREHILGLFSNKDSKPFRKIQNGYERIMSIAMQRQSSNQIEKIINMAISNSLGKYPKGIPITKEMLNKFNEELMEQIMPMIAHKLLNRNERDNE